MRPIVLAFGAAEFDSRNTWAYGSAVIRLLGTARLLVLVALVVSLGCAAARAPAPPVAAAPASSSTLEVAVTIDDLPAHGPLVPGTDRLALAARLLSAFAAHRLPPVYGFVNGKTVDDDATTEPVLRRWLASGNLLGNHTWSHPALNTTTLEDYLADIRKGETILKALAPDGGWKLFRYPFLQEGNTPEKRTGVRAALAREGYGIAEVTIDADDWAFNPPFARCTERNDRASLAELRRAFVAGHVEELRRMRAFARTLVGHDVPQVLLLHAGVADADAIDALLTAYEAEGVRWVDLRAALADPFYAIETKRPIPFGTALPYRIASERGLEMDPPVWARGLEKRLAAVCP